MPEEKKEVVNVAPRATDFEVLNRDPSEVREVIKANIGDRGVSAFRLRRIKVPAGGARSWTIPTLKGAIQADKVEGIIVWFADPRGYWRTPEVTGTPPDCMSDDAIHGRGIRWDDDDPSEAHSCESCKWAQFGSDPKGGRGQACKQRRAIFLLDKDEILPTLLLLPPTSLKAAQEYFYRLASRVRPFYGVVTSWSLESDKNATGQPFSRAVPTYVRDLTPEEAPAVKSYIEQVVPVLKQTRAVTGEDLTD